MTRRALAFFASLAPLAAAQTRLASNQLPRPDALNEVVNETVSVAVSDTESRAFKLAHPTAAAVRVYRNGLRQTLGVDYRVTASTVTFFGEVAGSVLVFDYKY